MLGTTVEKPAMFSTDKKSALDAISHAQFIAFAPYVFQASVLLRDKGILAHLDQARRNGDTLENIANALGQNHYQVRILLEAGLGIGLVHRKEETFFLSKTGHFFLNDAMTRVNTDFMRDVCYDGAQDLKTALEDGKPRGLRHLGEWETIYQGLSILPQPARDSWFAFDHYYSDNAFPEALPIVFAQPRKKILDIGSNTGKWALACLDYNKEVEVGLVDLQVQLNVAIANLDEAGYQDRYKAHQRDLLDPVSKMPEGYDVMWLSQCLDCFADQEIISILRKCHAALPEDGRIFINETFWDCQRFEASAFSLQMTSLYFTTMANGNSQMYDSAVFKKLIAQAGFIVLQQYNNIGLGHTILEIKKA